MDKYVKSIIGAIVLFIMSLYFMINATNLASMYRVQYTEEINCYDRYGNLIQDATCIDERSKLMFPDNNAGGQYYLSCLLFVASLMGTILFAIEVDDERGKRK